jgi:hypothetical protein
MITFLLLVLCLAPLFGETMEDLEHRMHRAYQSMLHSPQSGPGGHTAFEVNEQQRKRYETHRASLVARGHLFQHTYSAHDITATSDAAQAILRVLLRDPPCRVIDFSAKHGNEPFSVTIWGYQHDRAQWESFFIDAFANPNALKINQNGPLHLPDVPGLEWQHEQQQEIERYSLHYPIRGEGILSISTWPAPLQSNAYFRFTEKLIDRTKKELSKEASFTDMGETKTIAILQGAISYTTYQNADEHFLQLACLLRLQGQLWHGQYYGNEAICPIGPHARSW